MRIVHLAALIAAAAGGSTISAGLFLRAARRRCFWRQCNPRWLGRTADSASSAATPGFADPGRPLRHRAHPHSTHLTMANRANRWLLQRTYSARYLEARFETTAVVGHLSQSNATGRAFGHTKSRRLFSLLGGAERRAGIVVLPPRSTFPPTHSPDTSRRQEFQLWDPAEVGDILHSNHDGHREDCPGLIATSLICSHSGHPQLCQIVVTPTRAKPG